ncbi:phage gp16-like protein [Paucimonas lemoignei]|uniref:Phage gp16-like protein n=1 Tax=Paucimonas lemoignei TaxID=29443 RepID=A0A4R3I3I9_PAULE|nr:regulatory protein GemA [Paucimonas lemoignei]TCS38489.1 phage gp16-like protein [Paucimonas lemoignei]
MKPETASQIRNREMRLIHVAKRELQLDDETYRAMLWSIARVKSSKDLDFTGRKKVLDHLKARGFKVRSKAAPSPQLAQDAESKKIRALWIFLHQIGVVQNPAEEALAAYVKRITGVEALQWVNGKQALALIESLKKWAMRSLPDIVKQLAQEAQTVPMSDQDRAKVTNAVWKAYNRLTFDPMQAAWECLTEVMKQHKEENHV